MVSATRLAGRVETRMSLGQIRRWVQGHLTDARHERRVVRIATAIFDLTADLHKLGSAERRLLRAGAMLHDVGRYHGPRRHHVRGAQMVLDSRTLPVAAKTRTSLAYLVHHHRGPVPRRRREAGVVPAHDFRTMSILLAILRCADAFDSRRVPAPTLLLRRTDRSLRIRCYVECDPDEAAEVFDRRKKYAFLEELLDLPVRVEIRSARQLR